MFDVIVVGGGPAGMTAALYALRNGKNVLVIERTGFGGQITHSPQVENYPGFRSISGNEIAEKMLEQILAQGAEIEFENVTSIEDAGEKKLVHTEEGSTFECGAVILATGVEHRMLGLPGEQELIGEGISYCAVCDGDFYTGKKVCVAGGGNSALQEAILLAEKCSEVIMLQDLPNYTGEEMLQDVLFSHSNVAGLTNIKINALLRDEYGLSGVLVESRETGEQMQISCDGLFIAIGLLPENEPFASLAELNEAGYFNSDEKCLTKTPGIFVAGDCRCKEIRQMTTALGDGAVAGLAACRYLDGLL